MSAEDVHSGCDWMRLLHNASDMGVTVTVIARPDGVVEVRLIGPGEDVGRPFVADLDSAVEGALAWLNRGAREVAA